MERESEKVGLIRVDLGSFAREVTSRSSHEELEELRQLEKQGKVFLTAAEKLAAERWMEAAAEKEVEGAEKPERSEKPEKGSAYDREGQESGGGRKRGDSGFWSSRTTGISNRSCRSKVEWQKKYYTHKQLYLRESDSS